ncbi:MAG: hypothetical protein JWQ30_2045 [Sediminibacterium sp.]|nr:hypothetical protein [Sediminibacterium sp.]
MFRRNISWVANMIVASSRSIGTHGAHPENIVVCRLSEITSRSYGTDGSSPELFSTYQMSRWDISDTMFRRNISWVAKHVRLCFSVP